MRYLLPLVLLQATLATGCINCCYRANDTALKTESCPDLPADQRSKVYTVIVRGFDPLHVSHVEKLREELSKQGFAKIYCVDFYHSAFIEKEVRRIRCEDPDARFVIIGYSLGAGAALSLTTRLTQESAPIDALVEIAPVYLPLSTIGQDTSCVGRHVVLANAGLESGCHSARAEVYRLNGSGHLSIASHPVAVQTIRDLLMQAAEKVPPPTDQPVMLPLVENPAPLPTGAVIAPGISG